MSMSMTDFEIRNAIIGESPRCLEIDKIESYYNGEQYKVGLDARPYDWDTEVEPGTEKLPKPKKIPLALRRPKVVNLARYIVDRTSAWLFGERFFPRIVVEDDKTTPGDERKQGTQDWISVLAEATKLEAAWLKAAKKGGKGRTAVVVYSIVDGYPVIEHLPAKYCLPTFAPDKETLLELRLRFKCNGSALEEMQIPGSWDEKETYWFQRVYSPNAELNFYPVPVARDGRPPELVVDPSRSIEHNLGVLAAVWVRNLASTSDDPLDGEATYEPVVDLLDPINVLTSSAYRSIRKLSDPTLVIEDVPVDAPEDVNDKPLALGSSAGATIEVVGKAKLLEMQGTGQEAARTWVKDLMAATATISRVTNPDPEKLAGAAQSGYALEVLHAPLIELVGELRQQYGPALLRFVRLMLELTAAYLESISPVLILPRTPEGKINPKASLSLSWGRFFAPSLVDIKGLVETLAGAVASGFMSTETAIAKVCEAFGIEDIDAEKERIKAERGDEGTGIDQAIASLTEAIARKKGEQGAPDDELDDDGLEGEE